MNADPLRHYGGLRFISPGALLLDRPFGTGVYHATNRYMFEGRLMSLCGVYIDYMVRLAPKVADAVGRPCKDCTKRAQAGRNRRPVVVGPTYHELRNEWLYED